MTFKEFYLLESARPRESKRAAITRTFNQIIHDIRTRKARLQDMVAEQDGYIAAWSDNSKHWYTGYGWKVKRGQELKLDSNQIFIPGTLNHAAIIAEHLPSLHDIQSAAGEEIAGAILKRPEDETRKRIEAFLPNVQDETVKFLDKVSEPQLGFASKQKLYWLEEELKKAQQSYAQYQDYFTRMHSPKDMRFATRGFNQVKVRIAKIQQKIAAVKAKAKPL